MGAPIGNRNAAGSRGGATKRLLRASRKSKSRSIMSKLTGRKPRLNKIQLAIRSGSMIKTSPYAGLSWKQSAARFKKSKRKK